jgi:hypothetical protein
VGRSGAEQGERAGAFPGRVAQPGGDVGLAGQLQQANRQVAQAGHHLLAVPGTDLGAVLVEGDIANSARTILDLPLPADQHAQTGGVGTAGVQAGDAVDDLGARLAALQVGDVPGERERLPGAGEGDPAGAQAACRLRRSMRPGPRSTVVCAGG